MNTKASMIGFVLSREGGYSHDPDDPGGETNFGISKKSFPSEDIKGMTKERASRIYCDLYWDANHLSNLHYAVAAAVFDAAINCGSSRACRWLQESINSIIPGIVVVDGDIGPNTIARATQCDPMALAMSINSSRIKYYASISTGSLIKYLRGWVVRVADLQQLIAKKE